MKRLTKIAKSQPHAAYSALTHGHSSRWHFIAQTIPNLKEAFQPLEDTIRHSLLPVLLGISPPNDSLRDLLTLPPQWGGMGIFDPSEQCSREYDASLNITKPLVNCISTVSDGHPSGHFHEIRARQFLRKKDIRQVKQSYYSSVSCNLHGQLNHSLQLALDLATAKGASAWLSTLPLSEYGFTLHKSAFHDVVALCYGWPLSRTPSYCACGNNFSVEHVLSCPKGGLPSLCQSETCLLIFLLKYATKSMLSQNSSRLVPLSLFPYQQQTFKMELGLTLP